MIEKALTKLGRAQARHPWRFLAVAALFAVAFGPFAARLGLNSDLRAMLPTSADSVVDLNTIERRFSGLATLTIALSGPNIDEVHRVARELAPRLERHRREHVLRLDWNVTPFKDFVSAHKFLYADLADLRAARDAISDRLEYERSHANPLYVDLLGEDPPDTEAVLHRLQANEEAKGGALDKYPDGFFQHPRENIVFLFIRTDDAGGDQGRVRALLAAVHTELRAIHGSEHVRVDFGGDVMDVYNENVALTDAAMMSLGITLALVGLSIYLFYWRARAMAVLGLALLPAVAVTFGLAWMTVGFLNASSAFLSSIVVGNGINPYIVWLARYFEERRAGVPADAALEIAHHGTWQGTLAASLAAAASYASLVITDFRGFRDFGIIGGIGMLVCWLGTILVLPPMAHLFDRVGTRPLVGPARGAYGVVFAKVALRWPVLVAVVGVVLGVASAVFVGRAIARGPLETDFRNLESRRDPSSRVAWVNFKQSQTVDETTAGSAIAILAPSRSEAERVERYFERARPRFPRVYADIKSIDDLLPADQQAKLPVIAELRAMLLETRAYVRDEYDLAQIDQWMPPADVVAAGPDDLPACVAVPFTERDGVRGRLVFLEHDPRENGWDGDYLVRLTHAARTVRVVEDPSCLGRHRTAHCWTRPPVAGRAPIFADLQTAIFSDGPRSVGAALGFVALVLALAFRRTRDRIASFLTLLLGGLWMMGTCAALGMKLNFLNFAALPVTFGIGVDYGVNVMRRFVEETANGKPRLDAIKAAVEETGGAVILCSLTTIVGYISLFTSPNRALNSFGLAMAISEVTCLTTAVLVLPAFLALRARRRAAAADAAPPAEEKA